MKKITRIRSLAFTLLAAAILFTALGSALHAEKTELGDKMKALGKNLKLVKAQIADPAKQQSTVGLLESAKTNAEAAKKLTPSRTKEVPEADRAKFLSGYQAQIGKLVDDLGKIEAAVKAGKYDDAKKLFADLGTVKREGHEKFAPKD